jgi:hypothetical protein
MCLQPETFLSINPSASEFHSIEVFVKYLLFLKPIILHFKYFHQFYYTHHFHQERLNYQYHPVMHHQKISFLILIVGMICLIGSEEYREFKD